MAFQWLFNGYYSHNFNGNCSGSWVTAEVIGEAWTALCALVVSWVVVGSWNMLVSSGSLMAKPRC